MPEAGVNGKQPGACPRRAVVNAGRCPEAGASKLAVPVATIADLAVPIADLVARRRLLGSAE